MPSADLIRTEVNRPTVCPARRDRPLRYLRLLSLALVLGSVWLAPAACLRRAPSNRPLSILLGGDLLGLDPQASWDDVTWAVLGNVFDGLVQFDNSLRIAPRLATRWINPDEKTWRFFLDPQARFHDGQPLEAADVVFSFERLRALPESDLRPFAAAVESATAIDAGTVEITSSVPGALLRSLAFIPIMSRQSGASLIGPTALPQGTGPYRIVSWEPHRLIRLEAAPYRPPPRIRAVAIRLSTTPLTLDIIREVRPDLVLYTPIEMVTAFDRQPIPGLERRPRNGLGVFYVSFNVRSRLSRSGTLNPVGDVRVRRALALGTDREALVGPDALRHARPAFQLIPSQVVGFDASVSGTRPDLDAAGRLLRQVRPEGIRIQFLVQQGTTGRVERELLRQWSLIGVTGDSLVVPADEFRSATNDGEFQLVFQGYACTSGDAGELIDFALRSRDPVKGLGTGNPTGYRNAEVDRLAEANPRTGNPRRRLEMLQRALRLPGEELPYLPLFTRVEQFLASYDLAWDPPLNDDVRLENMYRMGERE